MQHEPSTNYSPGQSNQVDELITATLLSADPFATNLVALVPEIHDMVQHEEDITMRNIDEFTNLLFDLAMEKTIPMWAVVVCKTYMSITNVLRSKLGVGLSEWRDIANSCKRTIEKFQLQRKALPDQKGGRDEDMQEVYDHQEQNSQHAIFIFLQSRYGLNSTQRKQYHRVSKWLPTTLYAKFPLLPAMTMAWSKVQFHFDGCEIVNDREIVLSVAHLYKVCKELGYLKAKWKDMDWLLEMHSKKQPYISDIEDESDPSIRWKRFQIGLGAKPWTLPASLIGLSDPKAHIEYESKRVKRSYSETEFLTRLKNLVNNSVRQNIVTGGVVDAVLQQMAEKIQPQDPAQRQYKKTTPVQLLTTLEQSMLSDEVALNFDYIDLWSRCAALIQELRKNLPDLRKHKITETSPPSDLVSMLLWEASAISFLTATKSLSDKASNISIAAKVLESYIAKKGSELVDHAYRRSSGCLKKKNDEPTSSAS